MSNRYPLEAHTRTKIDLRLKNLGWFLDQRSPKCNVYQEQAKTEAQNKLFHGKRPDYVLYENGSDQPLCIIEAKRPGENLDKAIQRAIDSYAQPIKAPLVFAFNETFVYAKHVFQNRTLKIDGEELQDFIDELTAIRFVSEGPEILSAPKGLNFTREDLIKIFKETNKLLRKEGLRDGYERFSAFAEILFLKLIDESERLNEHKNLPRTIEKRFCWSDFIRKYKGQDLLDFVHDSVWPRLRENFGDIFSTPFGIKNSSTFEEIVKRIDPINLTSTDTDIKGDAFEYFLKTVTNGNKDLGEYFTPRHIVRTMVNLVKPIYGEKIYDPFCGTGGFLLEAFKYLSLRVDTTKPDILGFIKNESVFGREITSTSRIAKMNMILFGDGHSNIEQIDSLANPKKEEYDIVLSNIPYSQETEFGSYYPIPSKDGNSICVQHIWESLKVGGRAAVIVPETFLYEGGNIGKTRELIVRNSERLSVVSLPRGVFMPYTPTKTNIIYFKKGGNFKKSYSFVVFNDGFRLNTSRKIIEGPSDLKKLLSNYDESAEIVGQANIITRKEIEDSGNWNLRPFYYMEDIPKVDNGLIQIDESIIEERNEKIDPVESPNESFGVLEVSQNGVFLSDTLAGSEFTQKYKVVHTGDIVYNPYRVNIGSIAVVPSYLDGMLVSPAYVVFYSKLNELTPSYIVSILKHTRYLRVIMNYALGSARASLPFVELTRIKIPKPNKKGLIKMALLEKKLSQNLVEVNKIKNLIEKSSTKHIKG